MQKGQNQVVEFFAAVAGGNLARDANRETVDRAAAKIPG
jgi:hypothetical protein